MSGHLNAALNAAKRGWHVFPIAAGRKKPPLIPDNLNAATTDKAKIREWWTKWPDANIGVSCGPSGLVVLDVDTRNGKRGGNSLLDILEGDIESPLLNTLNAHSWSGGRHYFYKGKCGSTNGKLGSGLDIKGVGGYVVIAPSFVEEDGLAGKYRWERGDGSKWPIADFPDIFRPKETKKTPIREVTQFAEGGRHDGLVSLAGWYCRLGISPSAREAALQSDNLTLCTIPLDPKEVSQIAKSAKWASDPNAPKPGAPEEDDSKPLAVINASQASLEPVEWLWPGRIPLGLTTAIVGPEDAGKTFFYCALAAALSRGTPLPESKEGFACNSLLYHGEDLQTTIRDRLTRCGADLDRVQLINQEISSLSLRKLDTYLGEHPEVKLVVLDPVTVMLDGVKSDNNDTEVRRALLPLKALAEKRGIALLYLRHTGKNVELRVKDKVLGAKGFIAVPRTVLVFLEDAETKRRFCFNEKNNLREKAAPVEYFISDDGFAWGDTDESVCAEEFAKSRPKPKTAKTRLKAEEVIAWIRQALDEGPLPATMLLRLARANEIPERSIQRHKDEANAVSERFGKFAEGGRWYWYLHDKLPKNAKEAPDEADHEEIPVVYFGGQHFGDLSENLDSTPTITKTANRESMRAREGVGYHEEWRLRTPAEMSANGSTHGHADVEVRVEALPFDEPL
jgi:hypothetical protein